MPLRSVRPRHVISARWLPGVAVAGMVLAACGGSHTSTRSTASTGTTSTTSTTALAAPSTTTAPATSSTTVAARPAGPADCASGQLTVTNAPSQAGAGHSGVVVLFRNRSTATCLLQGYPGVAGLNSAGAQVTQAKRTPSGYLGGLGPGQTAPPVVALAPGQQASALVEGTDVPTGSATSCPSLAGLLVTAPNVHHSVHLSGAPGDCSGLQVHPVVAGTTGSAQG